MSQAIVCSVGLITFGAFQSVAAKLMLSSTSVGLNGEEKYFDKPYLLVFVMFLAMSSLGLVYWYKRLADYFLNTDDKMEKPPKIKLLGYLQMAVPSLCDLSGTVIMYIALMWMSVSICQMLRGLLVVFTGIFTLFIRKRKIFKFEYAGGLMVVISVVLLGFVEIMDGNSSPGKDVSVSLVVVAVVLMIISQALNGFQDIAEEALMHDVSAPPIFLASIEGLWGTLFTGVLIPVLAILPTPDGVGLHEDFLDSIVMMKNNYNLALLVFFFFLFTACFNLFYFFTIDLTNALFADIIQQVRNLLVWIMALLIHYRVDPAFGEILDWWSLVELIAFILMCLGIFVFRGVIHVSWLDSEEGTDPYVEIGGELMKKGGKEGGGGGGGEKGMSSSSSSSSSSPGGGGGGDGGGGGGFFGGIMGFFSFVTPLPKTEEEGGRKEGETQPLLKSGAV